MKKGELQLEPELHLDARERSESKKAEMECGDMIVGKKLKRKGDDNSTVTRAVGGVEADEFFGDDDEENEDENE